MAPSDSVTHWIGQLKAGEADAAQPLWERYFGQLVVLARQRLASLPRRAADEEDVALSAFDSFCRDARRGRFPQLGDRDDLWRLLVVMTAQKALDLIRREQAHKRRPGQTAPLSALDLEQVVGRDPTPEFAAQVAEECQRLLALLGDDELRSIAVWKMEGYSNAEIAGRLGCIERTIERRLQRIRKLWEQKDGPCPTP
jgi:DNA-directed RNA polymerase specialized sigma24 family protein